MTFKLINTKYEEKQNINDDFSKVSTIIRTQKKTRIYIRVERKERDCIRFFFFKFWSLEN